MIRAGGITLRIGHILHKPPSADGSTCCPGVRSAAPSRSSDAASWVVEDCKYLEIRLFEKGPETRGLRYTRRPASDDSDKVVLLERLSPPFRVCPAMA